MRHHECHFTVDSSVALADVSSRLYSYLFSPKVQSILQQIIPSNNNDNFSLSTSSYVVS
jgi:hypothetical protein